MKHLGTLFLDAIATVVWKVNLALNPRWKNRLFDHCACLWPNHCAFFTDVCEDRPNINLMGFCPARFWYPHIHCGRFGISHDRFFCSRFISSRVSVNSSTLGSTLSPVLTLSTTTTNLSLSIPTLVHIVSQLFHKQSTGRVCFCWSFHFLSLFGIYYQQ